MKQILKRVFIITNLVILTSCLSGLSVLDTPTAKSKSQIDETSGVGSGEQLTSNFDLFECTLPCWANIVPGVTTRQEAQTVLQQQYGVDNLEFAANRIRWTSSDLDGPLGGRLEFLGNTVEMVNVSFDAHYLEVRDFIEKFGPPELIRIAKAFSSEHQCAGASMFYSELGIEAWLIPDTGVVGVKEEQFIQTMVLLSPRLLKNWELTDSVLVEWSGYQNYCS